MAKTKAAGSTKYGRDSKPKYLGVKLYDGQTTKPGCIIVKQRGTKFIPGRNVKRGRDDTLYAVKKGIVKFRKTRKISFSGAKKESTKISVL